MQREGYALSKCFSFVICTHIGTGMEHMNICTLIAGDACTGMGMGS